MCDDFEVLFESFLPYYVSLLIPYTQLPSFTAIS